MGYKFCIDTSVVVSGKIIELINSNALAEYKADPEYESKTGKTEIILSRVMLAEVENQANKDRATGTRGMQVLEELYIMEKKGLLVLTPVGARPTLEQIQLNPGGECDSLIRSHAKEANAILITEDHIQTVFAMMEKIPVLYQHSVQKDPKCHEQGFCKLTEYFDDQTMSVHLIENNVPLVKRGRPGMWKLEPYSKDSKILDKKALDAIAADIYEEAKNSANSFIEKEMDGVSVIQLTNHRIVICRPPFSNQVEITAVKPLVKLSLEDYNLDDEIMARLDEAEGILVAGSPGAGKSTFISALTEFYCSKNKIIKTLESVRDLVVPKEVTQLAPLDGSLENTSDILLLIRPDFTIFDEVRTSADFKIFADMRLAGVGLVGVVHASKPIDAVQRFITRVELGVIPSVVDTVIFIADGEVQDVLSLELTVKKPSGFEDKDLSRPVVEVRDFLSGELLYEIYNFGSDTIVAPLRENQRSGRGNKKKNKKSNKRERFEPANEIEYDGYDLPENYIQFELIQKKSAIILNAGLSNANELFDIFSGDKHLFTAAANERGEILVTKRSKRWEQVKKAAMRNEPLFGVKR
jgi:ATPase